MTGKGFKGPHPKMCERFVNALGADYEFCFSQMILGICFAEIPALNETAPCSRIDCTVI